MLLFGHLPVLVHVCDFLPMFSADCDIEDACLSVRVSDMMGALEDADILGSAVILMGNTLTNKDTVRNTSLESVQY